MQLLPSGLVVPPLPYLLALAVGTLAVVWWVSALDPAVSERTVLAFAPWMVAGGGLHALYQAFLVPEVLRPLLAAPAVYVTTFVLAGAVWAGATAAVGPGAGPGRTSETDGGTDRESTASSDGVREGSATPGESTAPGGSAMPGDGVAPALGAAGVLLAVGLLAVAYVEAVGDGAGTRQLLWPPVGFIGAAAITAPAYYLLAARWPGAVDRAGLGGPLVVYAHALDGFSTALGIDVIGTGERTPLPARIMEFAGSLPTEPSLGRGWLFVLVKLVVAAGIVVLLANFVEEEPRQGNLLMAFVAAVGAGPAANNLFLFLLGG